MRRSLLFLVTAFSLSTVSPIVAAAGEMILFPMQDKHVHSSCIVELPNGDFMCCWFEGSGERKSPDVVVRGSRLKRGTTSWSKPFLMADTPIFPDLNPILFVDAKKRLQLIWIVVMSERWDHSLLRVRTSADYLGDGAPKWDWQDVILFKPGEKFVTELEKGYDHEDVKKVGVARDSGALVFNPRRQLMEAAKDKRKRQIGWMPRTHVLVLPSGRVLLPLYSDGYYVGLMGISDDGGQTWRASSPIPGVGINQPTVVRKKDGTLVAYMREEGDIKSRVLKSESKDDGETWSVALWTDLPNPNTSLEVIALHDGRWIMVYNDIEEGRDSLALAVSSDEGETWKHVRHFDRNNGGLFHYPSLIQSRDGTVHLTYTYQPEPKPWRSIKHVWFRPETITAAQ